MRRIQCPAGSELIQELAVGRILASRINDVVAKPDSRRRRDYLGLLNRQIRGFGDRDPNDTYRERPLVEAALRAFVVRHGTKAVTTGWFYQHPEFDVLGCAPDAVEADMVGITVHVRESEESYEEAVAKVGCPANMRVAQASMGVTGLPYWMHLNYWENKELHQRRLSEAVFFRNPHADELVAKLVSFYIEAVGAHLEKV